MPRQYRLKFVVSSCFVKLGASRARLTLARPSLFPSQSERFLPTAVADALANVPFPPFAARAVAAEARDTSIDELAFVVRDGERGGSNPPRGHVGSVREGMGTIGRDQGSWWLTGFRAYPSIIACKTKRVLAGQSTATWHLRRLRAGSRRDQVPFVVSRGGGGRIRRS